MDQPSTTPDDASTTVTADTPDQPAEGGPRPSLGARVAARLSRAGRRAQESDPAIGRPAEHGSEKVERPARTTPRPVVQTVAQTAAARRIATTLAVLLTIVIAVAFRGSWTAHSDAAKAAHFDQHGAWLYPFAPDGLIVLALVGAVVLRHKRWPSWYCLGVVTLFTLSSYTINHLHGLGMFEMVAGTGELAKPLPGAVVGLIAGQLVGAIAFGSHILMNVFRHLFPEALDARAGDPVEALAERPAEPVTQPSGPVEMSDPQGPGEAAVSPGIDGRELARLIYGACLDGGVKLSQAKLGELARISKRQAGYVQVDVEAERAEPAQGSGPDDDDDFPGVLDGRLIDRAEFLHGGLNGSAVAGGPAGGGKR